MLSLIELQNKKVEAKRKKYEKDEMDAYLELVFDNYKQLTEENAKLTEQLRNKERQMQAERDDFNTKIKTLRRCAVLSFHRDDTAEGVDSC